MSAARKLAVGSALAALLLGLLLWRNLDVAPSWPGRGPLVVYCAAGLRLPVESAAKTYETAYGVRIQLQYGGSGTLLSNLRAAGRGDLFVAADESYLLTARSNALVEEIIPLAHMEPVVALPKGNPQDIRSLDDLLRVRVALANPEAAAIGSVVRDALRKSGQWEAFEKHARVFKPTVADIANDIKLGVVDAGIVWDATVRQYPELEMLRVPVLSAKVQRLSLGVLKCSEHPSAALHYGRYLGAADRGLKEFAKSGYRPVEGDAWADRPQVVLFSGAANRLAIENTVQAFEQREGVRVVRVYNGCGILVSQMKAGQHPDAYLACDTSFVPPVQDLFLDPLNVSETDLVLLVAKGNPLGIRTVEDLARPGLKVGVANVEQSTLGALTERLLKELALLDRVSPNFKVQTPTADLLVNQMRTGSLDVVVVYEVSTSQVRDSLTVVRIDHPLAKAVQPYVIGKQSQNRILMGRLLAAICSAASRQQYEALGFRWRGDKH